MADDKKQSTAAPKSSAKSSAKSGAGESFVGWGNVRKSVQDWVDKHTPQGKLRTMLDKATPKSAPKSGSK